MDIASAAGLSAVALSAAAGSVGLHALVSHATVAERAEVLAFRNAGGDDADALAAGRSPNFRRLLAQPTQGEAAAERSVGGAALIGVTGVGMAGFGTLVTAINASRVMNPHPWVGPSVAALGVGMLAGAIAGPIIQHLD